MADGQEGQAGEQHAAAEPEVNGEADGREGQGDREERPHDEADGVHKLCSSCDYNNGHGLRTQKEEMSIIFFLLHTKGIRLLGNNRVPFFVP